MCLSVWLAGWLAVRLSSRQCCSPNVGVDNRLKHDDQVGRGINPSTVLCRVRYAQTCHLVSSISIHITAARLVYVYLPGSPQSPCPSAFGHSCILGLPIPEHTLARQARPRRQRASSTTLASSSPKWLCRRSPTAIAVLLCHAHPVPEVCGRLDLPKHCCLQLQPHPSHQPGVSPRLRLPRLQCTCAVQGCLGLGVAFPCTTFHFSRYLNSQAPVARGCLHIVSDASLS